MAGSPTKRARAERFQKLKNDPDFYDNICEAVASGSSLLTICREYDVAYTAVDAWLRRMSEEERQKYAHAREQRAQVFVDQIEFITRDVMDAEGMDPKRAKVAGDNLRWLAARHDPHLWGEKQQITHNHQGAVSLHLTAVRELAQQPGSTGHGATYDHEPRTIEHDSDDALEGSELL